MYEVTLYCGSTIHGNINENIQIKCDKEPTIDDFENLVFRNKNEIIFLFTRGSWQYWKKVEEE